MHLERRFRRQIVLAQQSKQLELDGRYLKDQRPPPLLPLGKLQQLRVAVLKPFGWQGVVRRRQRQLMLVVDETVVV